MPPLEPSAGSDGTVEIEQLRERIRALESGVDWAQNRLGIEWHQTTKDGRITLEPVFCLGLCACAPAAMVNGRLVGRLDDEAIDEIAVPAMKPYFTDLKRSPEYFTWDPI